MSQWVITILLIFSNPCFLLGLQIRQPWQSSGLWSMTMNPAGGAPLGLAPWDGFTHKDKFLSEGAPGHRSSPSHRRCAESAAELLPESLDLDINTSKVG